MLPDGTVVLVDIFSGRLLGLPPGPGDALIHVARLSEPPPAAYASPALAGPHI
ncbi:hypothetical protein [Streptomyces marincola]|uniref:hypothetical protein n=1 Tax=Streptomyces marincola TaxID=2878388 RepID=UPI001CF1E71C|nr:hypothetical protein [Streptomyces marincola]UCM86599.1 hypothetical protein LC193_00815 [Streptomyces marincola]